MLAELMVIVHLLQEDGYIALSLTSVKQSGAGCIRAGNGVEKRLRNHRIRQASIINHKPNPFLLKHMTLVNDENV